MYGKARSEAAISKKNGSSPDVLVRDHDAHVFVCKGGDCKKRGSKKVRKALKEGMRSEGMNGDVRVDEVSCLGLCKHGPNVVVYHGEKPGGTWYVGMSEDDAPEVVRQHLGDGEPVERIAAGFRPRKKGKKK